MAPEQHETEVTLLVCSHAPKRVIQDLEKLCTLGGMRLQAETDQALRDLYFDFPDSSLGERGYGLRLRQCNREWLLCLKRRGRRQGRAVRRLEVEGPPQDETLRQRIADEANLPQILGFEPGPEPLAALTAAGFIVIQDRRTLRRPRAFITQAEAAVANLSIDSVDYEVDGAHFWHHEVEIEAIGAENAHALDPLHDSLLEAYPQHLRSWRPSKLRTGLALQALVRQLGPATLVGPEGDLLPEAYDQLLKQLHPRR